MGDKASEATFNTWGGGGVFQNVHTLNVKVNEVLAIRRIFSLVDMITNTKFSNCPNIFKIGVVRQ